MDITKEQEQRTCFKACSTEEKKGGTCVCTNTSKYGIGLQPFDTIGNKKLKNGKKD
jgi:hypothetical protein